MNATATLEFFKDSLRDNWVLTLFVAVPCWLFVFSVVTILAFELIVNLVAWWVFRWNWRWYSHSEVVLALGLAGGVAGRDTSRTQEQIDWTSLMIGLVVASMVTFWLMRSIRRIDG